MVNCPYFSQCGGCNYLDMSYDEELNKKKIRVSNLFKTINYNKEIKINGADNPYNYRNKVIVAFKLSKTKHVVSGIYEENSHKIVVVKNCLIQNQAINQCLLDLEEALNENKILPFVNGGSLKHAQIRYAVNTDQLLVTLITSSEVFPGRNNLVSSLLKKNKKIKSIVQNIQPRDTSIVLGEKERVLYGSGYIFDTIYGVKFKISSRSFFQINPIQVKKLYDLAYQFGGFNKNDVVIDSYSGIGTIGLILSSKVRKTIEIELNKDAHNDAIFNAKQNGIDNAMFYNEDSTKFLEQLAKSNVKVDAIILDPPREGTTYKFIDAISKMNIKRVIYVSCGINSLIRDLKIFKTKGYVIKDVECVDMFPRTEHVETVASLYLKQ